MPFRGAPPEVSASAHASASSSAAQHFYSDDQAATYTTPANAGIQRDLTLYALELVHVLQRIPTQQGAFTLLDLGAGSGLSTRAASQWLKEKHVDAFALAFDISASMLSFASAAEDLGKKSKKKKSAEPITAVECGERSAFYCGNAAQKFPLRARTCEAAIGISMLQWLTDDGLRTCYQSLMEVLQDESAAVFQIYPTSQEQVVAMERIALEVGFAYAEVFVAFPHSTTAKKWYLALKKNPKEAPLRTGLTLIDRDASLCPFGRRHHRRCGWHLVEPCQDGVADPSSVALRERLGREHAKEAWHIWRKYHRAVATAAEAEKPVHFKAKRSLELWKSDEIIGEALRTRFLKNDQDKDEDETKTDKISYNFLLSQVDTVVDVLHTAYSTAVQLERSLQPPSMDASS